MLHIYSMGSAFRKIVGEEALENIWENQIRVEGVSHYYD